MSNQLQITGGAKVRNLNGVITGSTGVLGSLPINAANGIPQLDSSGKILVSQLPNSVMEFKGTWNVTTNTPYLVNGVGNAGDVYIVTGAATGGTNHDFGAGNILFYNGDQAIYDGSAWQRASGSTGSVTSVALTESGDALSITGSPITTSGTINIGFAGTSAQYVAGNGSLVTFPSIISQAQNLVTEVYNRSGATITKGTVVYINGGQGNLPTIAKAIATSDATSAQTYGVVQADITNMNNGYVVVAGRLQDIDTQAYTEGTQLYLSSTTAGAWTSTKQYAPAHLVYVGIVVRSHPTQGIVEIKIQNGYELDELHNVSAQTPSNNDGLFYNSSNSLWENKSIATALGYTPADDSLVVKLAGTQTITGSKTFSLATKEESGILLKNGTTTALSGYTGIGGGSLNNGIDIILNGSGFTQSLLFQTGAGYNYTFPATSGTMILGSGISGNVPFYTGTNTISSENGFMYDSSTNRFGVNTTVPNATIGANANIDSGYSLLLKNADANYNGIGFGINTTYGNTFETQKFGTAAARNLTLLNQSGYISLTEGGNLGINILSPIASPSGVGSKGIDIYGDSQAASIGFHNVASGTGNTNGAYLYLTNTGTFTLRNLEGGIGASSLGDFSVVTNSTENFRVNSVDGTIWQSNIPNALLKTVSGVLTAAVAGTDYVAPSALSGYVPTSRTLTINGTTYDLSANRSWSVGTTTGSGSADSVAFWNSSSNLTYDSVFYYSSTNKRLGVNTTSPNATIGANAGIDSGYSLLLKNAETNYNGLGFGINSTYGNTIETAKVGTASARNLTLFNQTGYATLTEAGNFGFNILTPTASPSGVGSVGIDIFGGASAAGLGFHNTASGTGNTNGAYLYLLNNSNFTIRNLEGPIGVSSLGDFAIVTNSTENFRVNSSNGTIWQSNISDSMLKTVAGVLTAAVAGTDYQTPITNPVSGTGTATRVAFWTASNTISSNANLYWDNTNARLGIGTASNISNALTIYSLPEASQLKVAGGAPGIAFTEALSGQQYLAIVGLATLSNNYITNTTAGDMAIANQTSGKSIFFGINSTEVMRMTSGGLSITGTKSQLTLTGNSSNGAGITLNTLISGTSRRNWGIFTEQNVSGDFVIKKSSSAGGDPYSGDTVLSFTNTAAATFASSVTALNGTFKNPGSSPNNTLFVQTSDYISSSAGSVLRIGHVATTGNTTAIIQNLTSGGTAVGNISFPEGNVGIGTTSPQSILDIRSSNIPRIQLVKTGIISWYLGDTQQDGSNLFSIGTDSGSNFRILNINNSGNVGIGTTSPIMQLHSSKAGGNGIFVSNTTNNIGGYIYAASYGFELQATNSSNSGFTALYAQPYGGNVLIGTTNDTGYKTYILQTTNREGLTVECNNASFDYSALLLKTARTTTNGTYRFTSFNNGTSDKLFVYDSGNVYNTNGTYGTISSDFRLKENIVEATSKLNDLLKLRVVNFNLKEDENKKKNIGFIAQEFKEVFPSLTYTSDTRKYDENGNVISGYEDSLGINVGMEFAILVKAIQELSAKVTELENKIN